MQVVYILVLKENGHYFLKIKMIILVYIEGISEIKAHGPTIYTVKNLSNKN